MNYTDKITRASLLYESATLTLQVERGKLIEAEESLANTQRAREIFQALSKSIQEDVHGRIASVVSRCLESVFDEPYEFKINFENKRGRTEASLVFVRDELELDPTSSCGGGVVDVAAFALRLACLCLSRPPLRRLLVLDEPFRFVSQGYRERIKSLVETLADELDVQFIIVTHLAELQIGKVIELT